MRSTDARRTTRRLVLGLSISILAVALVAPAVSAGPKTKLVSKDSSGAQASSAFEPTSSADGKIAAFRSPDGLVPGDSNGKRDVYFRGLGSNKTVLVSQSSLGVIANGHSVDSAISANGRYIVFSSVATNLIDGKTTSGNHAVYVRDRVAKRTKLVSVNNGGVQANGSCSDADISASGKLIIFECGGSVSNLTGKNTNGSTQVYLRNLNTNKTVLISQRKGKAANGGASRPAISPDGRYVVFDSRASNLGGNPSGNAQIFLRDWKGKKTTLISRNRFGKGANGDSFVPDVSNKGRTIVYESDATNLGTRDTNGTTDIYRFRRLVGPKGKTDRVSRNWKGKQLKSFGLGARAPGISKNGRYLAFEADFTNAIQGGISGAFPNIYLRDLKSGKLILVSRTGGTKGNGSSFSPFISANGKFVFFPTRATNLIPGGDANGASTDVLRRGPY